MNRALARAAQPRARIRNFVSPCLLAVLAGSVAAAAASAQGAGSLPPEEIEVDWHDNGGAYRVPPGSKLFIALPASPRSVGAWRWVREATDPEVVTRLQKPTFSGASG